jgi:hypothetical protein
MSGTPATGNGSGAGKECTDRLFNYEIFNDH